MVERLENTCAYIQILLIVIVGQRKQCRLNMLAPVLFCRDLYLCVSYRVLMKGMLFVYVRVSLSHNLIVTHRQRPVGFFVALSCADKGGFNV